MTRIRSPRLPSPVGSVSQLNVFQREYLADTYDSMERYGQGDAEKSRPEPVLFRWTADPGAVRYRLTVGEDRALKNARVFDTDASSLPLTNFKTGTQYFWRVSSLDEAGNALRSTRIRVFETEACEFRFLAVDGVTNARDLGGKKTADGKRIRQGLLIRSGKPESATEAGVSCLLDELGVRTEIELRHNANLTNTPFCDRVRFYHLHVNADLENLMLSHTREALAGEVRAFFEILSREENYPILFHCYGGMDRTGLFSFLLEGLLGVGKDTVYRDYVLSSFSNVAVRSPEPIRAYYAEVEKEPGITLAEKFYGFLNARCGVPAEQLDFVLAFLKE